MSYDTGWVVIHPMCPICEDESRASELCPDGACKGCWTEAGFGDWKDYGVPLWLRQKVVAGVIPNVIWGYSVWRSFQ
jgi:hypothetical protein